MLKIVVLTNYSFSVWPQRYFRLCKAAKFCICNLFYQVSWDQSSICWKAFVSLQKLHITRVNPVQCQVKIWNKDSTEATSSQTSNCLSSQVQVEFLFMFQATEHPNYRLLLLIAVFIWSYVRLAIKHSQLVSSDTLQSSNLCRKTATTALLRLTDAKRVCDS